MTPATDLARHEAAVKVVHAVVVPGPAPATHRATWAQLGREWPALAIALRELCVAYGERAPS